MSTEVADRSRRAAGAATDPVPARRRLPLALAEVRWAALALVLCGGGLAEQLTGGPPWLYWALYLACYAAGGWQPARVALRGLRRKALEVDVLMVAAAIGAAAIGQISGGALLVAGFATAGALRAQATARAAGSVRGLLDLAPERARRLTEAGEEAVDTAALAAGDVILVRPGERIGADGTVIDGASEVVVAAGSVPLERSAGSAVLAGARNGAGMLRVRVDRPAPESVAARVGALVEQASATMTPRQLLIEKLACWYAGAVIIAALAVFAVPVNQGAAPGGALLRAITFLIVASPCALVLSTMPPLLSVIAGAGRRRVLVKSAVAVERLAAAGVVVFDRAGTLTAGEPHVADVRPLAGSEVTVDQVLALAAAAEYPSEHLIGRAIVAAARARSGTEPAEVTAFRATPGRGVTATVGGHTVAVGSPAHMLAPGEATGRARRLAGKLELAGHTAVVVVLDGKPVGVLAIADRAQPDAARTVAALTELTGWEPILLTGDNERAATRLAVIVGGINDVRAGLLPQHKVAAVEALQAAGERTLVITDGSRDAPVLAAAHASIAMGGAGTDPVPHTADAVVVGDALASIPAVIARARAARRAVVQNLAVAAAVVAGLVVWNLVGHLPLTLGVVAHEGSTLLVGLNGLRLLWSHAS